jgi:hypothetical protein
MIDDFYYDDLHGEYEFIINMQFLLSSKVSFDLKYDYQNRRRKFMCGDFFVFRNKIKEYIDEAKAKNDDWTVISLAEIKCKRIAGFVVGI